VVRCIIVTRGPDVEESHIAQNAEWARVFTVFTIGEIPMNNLRFFNRELAIDTANLICSKYSYKFVTVLQWHTNQYHVIIGRMALHPDCIYVACPNLGE
jgi:hypothetical protein